MDLIEVINDTLKRANSEELRERTAKAIESTKVYREGFTSPKTPGSYDTVIDFSLEGTLEAAKKLVMYGNTAVLNFANPVTPGGGVIIGAQAQEEYICRASNLYPCLISKNAAEYYADNRELMAHQPDPNFFEGSDAVVYTKGVCVFKDANCEYTDDRFYVDVITCAAPMFRYNFTGISAEDFKKLMEKRIRNILETAIHNCAECIVLGAFGCGAFKNPPELVAEAFKNVLCEDRYSGSFKHITFAIKGGGRNADIFKEKIASGY